MQPSPPPWSARDRVPYEPITHRAPFTLPGNARQTHLSLFDGSNCGMELTDRPAFSVQYHPEASPGPQDSHYLFDRFVAMIEKAKAA